MVFEYIIFFHTKGYRHHPLAKEFEEFRIMNHDMAQIRRTLKMSLETIKDTPKDDKLFDLAVEKIERLIQTAKPDRIGEFMDKRPSSDEEGYMMLVYGRFYRKMWEKQNLKRKFDEFYSKFRKGEVSRTSDEGICYACGVSIDETPDRCSWGDHPEKETDDE